ncbi:DUF2281 domain-containing protein [Methylomagnum sp.]
MSSIAEEVFQTVQALPALQAVEVLDFAKFLLTRQRGELREITERSPVEADDWSEFEHYAGAWSGKFNREECYDRPSLR